MMTDNNSLERLIERCRDGEREAFEALFELYQPRLKYYVRRLHNGDSQVDDVLQDIWLTVIRKVRGLKRPGGFAVWLYRIARNRVYDGFRRKDKFVQLPEDHDVPASENSEPDFDDADAEKLHAALETLTPPHKEALTLCFLEQMPYQAIAEVMECSVGTVRSRIHYAKKSLREAMERQS
ncbi:MAG: sigma-70 family RNA polymerase sigma factor [Sedimentisphaerales bacterium]|nr:sigma-70 family RNA polymerase sigma factor [Sedimentisphaerales bacterium]